MGYMPQSYTRLGISIHGKERIFSMTDCENCRYKAVPDAGYAPKGFLG